MVGDTQGAGLLTISGGTLKTGASSNLLFLYVGSGEGGGSVLPSGTVVQSGGIIQSKSVISLAGGLNAYGEYDLSGGTINGGGGIMVADDTFGVAGAALGTGLFNQTGGTIGKEAWKRLGARWSDDGRQVAHSGSTNNSCRSDLQPQQEIRTVRTQFSSAAPR